MSSMLKNETERGKGMIERGLYLNRMTREAPLGRGYLNEDHKEVRR